jgi:hypothetical protein
VVEEAASTAQTQGKAFDQPMFRAMKQDPDGYPVVGRSGRTLGVRVDGSYRDLPVAEDGAVAPETGGMSVALEKPGNLPKHRLPRSLGGEGRDPIFRLFAALLPEALLLRPDRYPHAYVEPRRRCPLPQFESALNGTRNDWSKVHD